MSGDDVPPGELSAEDADLWNQVTATTTPLDKSVTRITRQKLTGRPARKNHQPVHHVTHNHYHPPWQPDTGSSAQPQNDNFNRRQIRKLSNGQTHIDNRLDLHGKRQQEAHRALTHFIIQCRARNDRHILVITGKGQRRETREFTGHSEEQPGVLKRLVPLWLDEPGLSDAISSYTTAHPRHGGTGALYIRLRRRH